MAAGILSLSAALALGRMQGIRSSVILQSIASGLLNNIAFMGGRRAAALGAVLHFMITLGAAAVYCVLARKLSFMNRHFFIVGLMYGIMIFLVMRVIILPLSAFPGVLLQSSRFFLGFNLIVGLLIHMFLVGYPVAWVAAIHGATRQKARQSDSPISCCNTAYTRLAASERYRKNKIRSRSDCES